MIRPGALWGPFLAGLLLTSPAVSREIALGDLATLESADVIFVGEIHDNALHHANQAAAISALNPAALVFEMFGPQEALRAAPEIRSDPGQLAEALRWDDLGWPSFAMYHPIFLAMPEGPVFGGAIPRGEARRAVESDAATVFGSGAAVFGLDQALDPEEQAVRETAQMTAHCDALPEDILPGMVEAQRLRDAALARAVVAAMAETGGPVVVITGNGHAREDWGVPRMLGRAQPGWRVLTIGQFEAPPEPPVPFDLWLVTAPAERDDPCNAFRQ